MNNLAKQINDLFGDRLVIPIAEVAEVADWSLRTLIDACRSRAVSHVEHHGRRSMTRDQVTELITRHTRAGTGPDQTVTDLEEARLFNAGRGRRSA